MSGYAKNRTPEHRRNLSQAAIGRTYSEEERRKNSEAHKGKRHTEETKRKMSEAHPGQKAWNRGLKLSKEIRKRISEGSRGEKCHRATITEKIAWQIKIDIANGMRICNVMKKYDISRDVISKIKQGKSWSWLKVETI